MNKFAQPDNDNMYWHTVIIPTSHNKITTERLLNRQIYISGYFVRLLFVSSVIVGYAMHEDSLV